MINKLKEAIGTILQGGILVAVILVTLTVVFGLGGLSTILFGVQLWQVMGVLGFIAGALTQIVLLR